MTDLSQQVMATTNEANERGNSSMEHKHPIDKVARERIHAEDFAVSKKDFNRIQRSYLIADLKAFALVIAVIVAVVAALN